MLTANGCVLAASGWFLIASRGPKSGYHCSSSESRWGSTELDFEFVDRDAAGRLNPDYGCWRIHFNPARVSTIMVEGLNRLLNGEKDRVTQHQRRLADPFRLLDRGGELSLLRLQVAAA